MGVALYRKYRSKSLDEVVGQDHITSTLKNALKNGKVSHAYLLTGPRGVGKTSIARILAYEVNDLPYDEQVQPLDIIEIDAASNRRIDEVRDLRDKVHILPAGSKYKVYIIDEVHMLTREAFNALLKTLEEPPAHAIFILATTEAHKLPDTIISRTQHFAFKPIAADVLVEHLSNIAKSEKIDIDHDALALIAQHGRGSFRDCISLLDQARNLGDHITRQDVLTLLGIAPEELVTGLADAVDHGSPHDILAKLQFAREQGVQSTTLSKQLSSTLRDRLIAGSFHNTQLLKDLVEIPASTNPDRLLELLLLEAQPVQAPKIPVKPTLPPEKPSIRKEPLTKATKQVAEHQAETESSEQVPVSSGSFTIDDWPAVLATIKKKHNTLYGILRMAEATLDNDTLRLNFRFAFHQKQIKDARNQKVIKDTLFTLFGAAPELECNINTKAAPNKPSSKAKTDTSAIENVSNIFGGAEVLES